MDIEKLIERLYKHHTDWGEGRTQDFFEVCLDCKEAATDLSTLQAENERLQAELNRCREKNAGLALALLTECASNPDCLGDDEWRAIRAELEQVKRNLDSAVEHLRGQCRYCKRNLVCTSRKGPHSNCWEWRDQKEANNDGD